MKMPLGLAGVLLPCVTISCASGGSSARPRSTLAHEPGVDLVTLRLVDVMISPTRVDGKPWDVAAQPSEPGARDRVVKAMNAATNAKGAYEAATGALRRIADGWGGLPDVGGTASVDAGDGKPLAYAFEGEKDTLTPHFSARWEHVPLTHWTTVHMYFVDQEAVGHSDIGAVVLSPLDLGAALADRRGEVHHVRVDDQTNGQILFVGFAVQAED